MFKRFLLSTIISLTVISLTVIAVPLALTNSPQQINTVPEAQAISVPDSITIPKLNVYAPVIYEPSLKEVDIQRALQDGVVHYGGTGVPGNPGNVVIFGHSSNDYWEQNQWSFIFVLLDRLRPGDRFYLTYKGGQFVYEVTGSRVVEPTEVSILNQSKEATATVFTCWPIGTSKQRLVVSARLVKE